MKCCCLPCFPARGGQCPTVLPGGCAIRGSWTQQHAAHGFAKAFPADACREHPWMVAIRDTKLLSQKQAGSRRRSDGLHRGMPGRKLIGDHLAGGTGKSATVQLPAQDFLGAAPSPLSHAGPQKYSSGLQTPQSRATAGTLH